MVRVRTLDLSLPSETSTETVTDPAVARRVSVRRRNLPQPPQNDSKVQVDARTTVPLRQSSVGIEQTKSQVPNRPEHLKPKRQILRQQPNNQVQQQKNLNSAIPNQEPVDATFSALLSPVPSHSWHMHLFPKPGIDDFIVSSFLQVARPIHAAIDAALQKQSSNFNANTQVPRNSMTSPRNGPCNIVVVESKSGSDAHIALTSWAMAFASNNSTESQHPAPCEKLSGTAAISNLVSDQSQATSRKHSRILYYDAGSCLTASNPKNWLLYLIQQLNPDFDLDEALLSDLQTIINHLRQLLDEQRERIVLAVSNFDYMFHSYQKGDDTSVKGWIDFSSKLTTSQVHLVLSMCHSSRPCLRYIRQHSTQFTLIKTSQYISHTSSPTATSPSLQIELSPTLALAQTLSRLDNSPYSEAEVQAMLPTKKRGFLKGLFSKPSYPNTELANLSILLSMLVYASRNGLDVHEFFQRLSRCTSLMELYVTALNMLGMESVETKEAGKQTIGCTQLQEQDERHNYELLRHAQILLCSVSVAPAGLTWSEASSILGVPISSVINEVFPHISPFLSVTPKGLLLLSNPVLVSALQLSWMASVDSPEETNGLEMESDVPFSSRTLHSVSDISALRSKSYHSRSPESLPARLERAIWSFEKSSRRACDQLILMPARLKNETNLNEATSDLSETLLLSAKSSLTGSSLNLEGADLSALPVVQELCHCLRCNSKLTHLNLSKTNLNSSGYIAIAKTLHHHRSLRYLDLSECNVSFQTMMHAASLFPVKLQVTGCPDWEAVRLIINIKSGSATEVLVTNQHTLSLTALQHVTNSLKDSRSLRKKLTDALAIPLVQNCGLLSSLSQLDLSHNQLTNTTVYELCEFFSKHSQLRVLRLNNNKLRDDSGTALFKLLKFSTSLKTLDLSNNLLQDKGSRKISEALKVNSTLEVLSLSFNKYITYTGICYLAESLRVNKGLKSLSFEGNIGTGDQGASVLADALRVNTSLEELNMRNTNLYTTGKNALMEAASSHPNVTVLL